MTGAASRAICSIGAGAHADLLALSRPTFEAYAERHGYELVTTNVADARRPPAWAKVPLLQRLLEDYELVLWLDADAIVVDPSGDIAALLEPDRELGIVRHRHHGQLVPNTGVMLLRAGAFARTLLARMWSATHLVEHPWWDNAALVEALGYALPGSLEPGLRGRVHRVAKRRLGRELRPCVPAGRSELSAGTQYLGNEWNSVYHDPAERPRIVHCLGTPVDQRLRDMAAVLREHGDDGTSAAHYAPAP